MSMTGSQLNEMGLTLLAQAKRAPGVVFSVDGNPVTSEQMRVAGRGLRALARAVVTGKAGQIQVELSGTFPAKTVEVSIAGIPAERISITGPMDTVLGRIRAWMVARRKAAFRPATPGTIASRFVRVVAVTDPDSGLPVEVEIRKLATGGLIGIDGSFLEQDVGEVYSPYDRGVCISIPDDEERIVPAGRPRRIPRVRCKFCGRLVPGRTAHLHQGGWVGDECCWDERLRSTE